MPAERADGKISISYELAGGEHIFRIADNGPGIDPEDQPNIFRIFHRGRGAEAVAADGRGLGLAVVRSIASNYEGLVWVESRPGEGSKFYLSLSERCTRPPAAVVSAQSL
jgi:signal transduction histidine kinase